MYSHFHLLLDGYVFSTVHGSDEGQPPPAIHGEEIVELVPIRPTVTSIKLIKILLCNLES